MAEEQKTDDRNGWNIACLLGGVLIGILLTLGALHTWGCLRFGGAMDAGDVSDVMAMVKDQKRETKERLDGFYKEMEAWARFIERHVGSKPIGIKPIGAQPLGSP